MTPPHMRVAEIPPGISCAEGTLRVVAKVVLECSDSLGRNNPQGSRSRGISGRAITYLVDSAEQVSQAVVISGVPASRCRPCSCDGLGVRYLLMVASEGDPPWCPVADAAHPLFHGCSSAVLSLPGRGVIETLESLTPPGAQAADIHQLQACRTVTFTMRSL